MIMGEQKIDKEIKEEKWENIEESGQNEEKKERQKKKEEKMALKEYWHKQQWYESKTTCDLEECVQTEDKCDVSSPE